MQEPSQNVGRFEWLAVGIGEYQCQGTLADILLMLLKGKEQPFAHGDHALTSWCLRQAELATIERSPDVNQASIKIDVRPLKSQQLGNAHSRYSDQQDHRVVRLLQLYSRHSR